MSSNRQQLNSQIPDDDASIFYSAPSTPDNLSMPTPGLFEGQPHRQNETRMLQQSVAVAAALTRAQQVHNSRLEQVAATLSRAQQLHSTAAAIRLNLGVANNQNQLRRQQQAHQAAAASRAVRSFSQNATAAVSDMINSTRRQPSTGSAYPSSQAIDSRGNSLSSAANSQFADLESILLGSRFQIPDQNWTARVTANSSMGASFPASTTLGTRVPARQSSGGSSTLLRRTGTVNPSIHPQFRSKVVVKIYCSHCATEICKRGMKAILLGNTKVELYSTDTPPAGVQLVYSDYTTRNCLCRIRDGACLGCGNVVGYHVTQPCEGCLEACNNGMEYLNAGHFWMFHADGVKSTERMDETGKKTLRWASLPAADDDEGEAKGGGLFSSAESLCR